MTASLLNMLCKTDQKELGFFRFSILCYFQLNINGSKTKRKTKEDLDRGCRIDCQARKLNTEDAMDHSKWRKLIKDVR